MEDDLTYEHNVYQQGISEAIHKIFVNKYADIFNENGIYNKGFTIRLLKILKVMTLFLSQ